METRFECSHQLQYVPCLDHLSNLVPRSLGATQLAAKLDEYLAIGDSRPTMRIERMVLVVENEIVAFLVDELVDRLSRLVVAMSDSSHLTTKLSVHMLQPALTSIVLLENSMPVILPRILTLPGRDHRCSVVLIRRRECYTVPLCRLP